MNALHTLSDAVTRALVQRQDALFLAESTSVPGVPPDRLRSLPISDRATLGVALGLAVGARPAVVMLTSTARLLAGLELLYEAAKADLGAAIVVRVPFGREAGDRVDLALLDALAGVPGLRVCCPRDAARAEALAAEAISGRAPVVLLETRAPTPSVAGAGPIVRDGEHVTLAAFGAGVSAALEAAEVLAGEGIGAQVFDLEQLCPVPEQALGAAVRHTGRLVVSAPSAEHAFARRVCRAGLDAAFLYLEAPLAVVGDDAGALVTAARAAVHY